MRTRTLRPEELKRLQEKKLERMIRFAYESIPYYHDLMHSNGILPSDFAHIEELSKLPLLTRSLIRENYPARLVLPNKRIALTSRTSGSTGPPLEVPWPPEYVDLMLSLSLRHIVSQGVRPLQDRVIWVPYFGEDVDHVGERKKSAGGTAALKRTYKILFGTFFIRTPVLRQHVVGLGRSNLNAVARKLSLLKPDVLYTRPSFAREIYYSLKSQNLGLKLRRICVEGEVLSAGIRSELEELYKCEVFNGYGSVELGALGHECTEHSGFHLDADYFIYEFIRQTSGSNGNDSSISRYEQDPEIVITSLHNQAMPLIRYAQGDLVEPLEESEKCGCGSYLPRLKQVKGRLADGLVTINGERIPTGPIVDHLETVLQVRDYRVIQKRSDQILVMLNLELYDKQRLESISHYLCEALGEPVQVEFGDWKSEGLPPKYRPVVNLMQ